MRKVFFAFYLLSWVQITHAAEASLTSPAEAFTGATVEISWVGPGENYDSIYVLDPAAPDSASGITSTSILSQKNPVSLVMPDEPGQFEIRYWSRSAKQVLARQTITLVDAPTTLTAADQANLGSQLEVQWQSSGNSYDLILLYPAGAADDAKAVSSATVLRKNPVILQMPETPGEYEIRYVTRMNKRVLARQPITVVGVETAIESADQAKTGATVEVSWQGPGNQYDKIALFPASAADDAKPAAISAIVSRRNPVTVRLPEQAGNYEWRYLTAREGHVLARRPFVIVGVDAAIQAPARALASSPVDVGWTGPGNNYDQIQLVDTATQEVLAKAAILSGRNPVLMNLPDVEGSYQLRYVTTQTGQVLATREILIQPAGRLSVSFERTGTTGGNSTTGVGAVELILDASGSMLQRTESGERRIEIAKAVLQNIVAEYLADEQQFAMRVFGHQEANSCRTDLVVPLQALDRAATSQLIASVNAMNLAKTPIADSLALVPNDLATAQGPKTIVLITDGEETCEGDPVAVIKSLRAKGLDIQLSIVGFAIDDEALKADFEQWASLGGGSYFDAQSAEELLQSLRTVISGPFKVLNEAGEVVGEGIIGGADIVLPAGTYRVETADARLGIDDVQIEPRELTEVAF
ncbi:MAG: VWA domain-containing protein [Pseudomonadales bacterium]